LRVSEIAAKAQSMIDEVERVIVGKRSTVEKAVLTLICNGHLLIEDIPGVGKTTLAKALAIAMGGEFRRLQFTPDLLPADITGSSIFNQKTAEFEFRRFVGAASDLAAPTSRSSWMTSLGAWGSLWRAKPVGSTDSSH